MATIQTAADWQKEWFEIADATYLNTAAHAAMPRVSLRAVQVSLEAKRFPHHINDSVWFEAPNRIRASLSKMIGAKPEEIALTTGASTGVAAVAHGLTWKPGDEIITAKGEFPLQYATWKPMEEREGVKLKIVAPRDRFVTADDLIAAMTPRTRVISVSHVRFDDGSLLDASRVAAACHAQGALLVLDVSQSCGAVPMDVNGLGADFLVCAAVQVAAESVRHWIFLGEERTSGHSAPGTVLLDGPNRRHFFDVEFCRSQTIPQCEALGRGGSVHLFQFQPDGHGRLGGFCVACRA